MIGKVKRLVTVLLACLLSASPTMAAEVEFSLSWTAPSTRTDGTPLAPTELGGFRVYSSIGSGTLGSVADIANGSATGTKVVLDLAPGADPHQVNFAVTAYDVDGRESAFSNIVTKNYLVKSTALPASPIMLIESARCLGECVINEVAP